MPIWGTSLLILGIIGFVAALFFVAMGKSVSLSFFSGGDSHSEAESKAITEAAMYQRQLLAAANMVNLQQKNKPKQDPWKQTHGQGEPVGSFGKQPNHPPPILYAKNGQDAAPEGRSSGMVKGKSGKSGVNSVKSVEIQGRSADQPKAQSLARVKQNIKEAMSRYVSNRSLEEQRIKSMEEDREKRALHLYGSSQRLSPGYGAEDRNEKNGSEGKSGSAGRTEKVKPTRVSTRKSTKRQGDNQVADSNLAGYTSRKTVPKAPKPTIQVANRTPKPSPSGNGLIANRGVSFSRLKAAMHKRLGGAEETKDVENGQGYEARGVQEQQHVTGDEEEFEQVGPPLDEHRPLSTGILSAVSSSVSQPRLGGGGYETEEDMDNYTDSEERVTPQRTTGLSYARQSFARLREKMSNAVRPIRPPPGLATGPRQPPFPPPEYGIQPETLANQTPTPANRQQSHGRGSYRRPVVQEDYESSLGDEDSYSGVRTHASGSQYGTGAVRMKRELGDASSVGRSGTESLTEYQAKFSQAPEAFSTTGSQTMQSQRRLPRKKSVPPGLLIPGTNRETQPGPPPRTRSQKFIPTMTQEQLSRRGPPSPPV